MSVAYGGIVGSQVVSATDTITLTLTADVAASVSGAGTAIGIYVVGGYAIDSGGGNVGFTVTGVTDDHAGGPNLYKFDYVSCFSLPNECRTFAEAATGYSGAVGTICGDQTNPQGGTWVFFVGCVPSVGFTTGDTITITLSNTMAYAAAYAFVYTGNGVGTALDASSPFCQEVWWGGDDESFVDATYPGVPAPPVGLAGLTINNLHYHSEQLVFVIMQAWALDLSGCPLAYVASTDSLVDGLGIWTFTGASDQIAEPGIDEYGAVVYAIYRYTWSAANSAYPIAKWSSSPSRRVVVGGATYSPYSGMYQVSLLDEPLVPPSGPVFNRHIRIAD